MKGLSLEQIESLRVLNSDECVPCTYPWVRLTEKNVAGEYTFCAWIDKHIGCVGKEHTHRLLPVWNSPEAQRIRRSLLEGNGSSCRNDCKVRDSALDTFLGYAAHEYETFDPVFLENLLLAARSIVDRSSEISCKPITLALYPSNICNIRCRMCKMEKRYDGDVTPKYFDGVKPLLPYLHELFVAGGEPFSCKTTKDIIFGEDVQRYQHIHISTITNSTLMDEAVLERLAGLRLGRIIFSLDGITPEVYNKIRIGADFETVRRNIKRFIARRDSGVVKVKITGSNFVIQALNYHEIEQYLEFCHALGIRASLNLVHGSTELGSCISEVQRHVARGIKRARELHMDYSQASLEGVMRKLPAYGDGIRKRIIMDGVFGRRNVTRVKRFFDKHEFAKGLAKKLLSSVSSPSPPPAPKPSALASKY